MGHAPIGMILAAGFGKRLYPLSELRPKPIMEIATKPIIFYLIKMLERAGVNDIIINLHYQADQIRKNLANHQFKSRLHLVYEPEIYNTAGGLANALRILGCSDRPIVVVHGDILCDFDVARGLQSGDFCTLVCDEDRCIEGYQGSIGIDRQENVVELGKFYTSSRIPHRRGFFTGIQFLSKEAVRLIRNCQKESLVADIYPRWLNEGYPIKAVMEPLFYDDFGTKQRIFKANMKMVADYSGSIASKFLDYTCVKNQLDVFASANATIEEGAKLYGPVLLGSAHIKHGASVGPNAVIGDRVVVENGAVVANCVILSDTVINKIEPVDSKIALGSARVLVR